MLGGCLLSAYLTVPTAKPVADFHRQVITHAEHTTKKADTPGISVYLPLLYVTVSKVKVCIGII